MRGFQGDTDEVTAATVPDCATYSGVTKTANAKVRTRRVHSFKMGDLVIHPGGHRQGRALAQQAAHDRIRGVHGRERERPVYVYSSVGSERR